MECTKEIREFSLLATQKIVGGARSNSLQLLKRMFRLHSSRIGRQSGLED